MSSTVSRSSDGRPVRPGEAGSADLARKDRHLVAQHEDLGVLRDGVPSRQLERSKGAMEQAVEEGRKESSPASSLADSILAGQGGGRKLLDPSRWRRAGTRAGGPSGPLARPPAGPARPGRRVLMLPGRRSRVATLRPPPLLGPVAIRPPCGQESKPPAGTRRLGGAQNQGDSGVSSYQNQGGSGKVYP